MCRSNYTSYQWKSLFRIFRRPLTCSISTHEYTLYKTSNKANKNWVIPITHFSLLKNITVKIKLLAVFTMDTWIVVLEVCKALLKAWSIKILVKTMQHPNPACMRYMRYRWSSWKNGIGYISTGFYILMVLKLFLNVYICNNMTRTVLKKGSNVLILSVEWYNWFNVI